MQSRLAHFFTDVRKALVQKNTGSPEALRLFLTALLAIIGLAFIAYICAFKLLDRDFWWHITAGEVMVKTQALIQTEPFSWTRAGMPYIANHEWLAQILLYLFYAAGGSTAIILFRTLTMIAALAIPLMLWRKGIWLMMPLAILAANAIRPSFIERPQLFTFVIFSACTALTLWILERGNGGSLTKRESRKFLWSFALLEILWVNLHGGAAFLSLLFPAALFADALWQWVRTSADKRRLPEASMRWAVMLGAVFCIGFFLSPTTYHNVTYLWKLLSDRTIIYIQEWQPGKIDVYLKYIAPFWLIAGLAIRWGKKNIVASVLLVLATGILSRQALRHEALFVLAAFAVTVYQLKGSDLRSQWSLQILQRPLLTVLAILGLLFGLCVYTHAHYADFVKKDQLQGYGIFDFGGSAVDFLEREHISGTMFNTYGIGGYLIHRGYPDPARKVFIDGRNVDYGFAMMNQTYLAGTDPVQWQKLDDKYHFTYAVVDYFANENEKKHLLYYSQFLDVRPDWALVYFDDWVAIYLKDIPENKAVIDRLRYKIMTATNMEYKSVMENLPESEFPTLEKELKRAVVDSPKSIKARIMLAKLLIRQQRLDEAQVVAQDAAIARPNSPEPHAMFAAIYTAQQRWDIAADELEQTLRLAGNDYPDIDYAFVAEIFLRAGRIDEARMYARRAGKTITEETEPAPSAASGAVLPPSAGQSSSAVPMVNPAQDALDFHDKALAFAEAGNNAEARENFLLALKLNPSFAQAWNNLGTLSFFEGKLEEARTQYERALKEQPEYADAEFNLALLLLQMKNFDGAKPHIARAKELGKDVTLLEQMLKKQQ